MSPFDALELAMEEMEVGQAVVEAAGSVKTDLKYHVVSGVEGDAPGLTLGLTTGYVIGATKLAGYTAAFLLAVHNLY